MAAPPAGAGRPKVITQVSPGALPGQPPAPIAVEAAGDERAIARRLDRKLKHEPGNAQLLWGIFHVLKGKDLSTTTPKQLRLELEQQLGLPRGSLENHKERVRLLAMAEVLRLQARAGGGASGSGGDAEAAPSAADARPRGGAKRSAQEGEEGAIAPMTRRRFAEAAEPLVVQVAGQELCVPPTRLSFWGASRFFLPKPTEVQVDVAGRALTLKCKVECIVDGSEAWRTGSDSPL